MPRHPRIHSEGLLYHIIVRGNNRQEIIRSKKDAAVLQICFSHAKKHYPFKLYAYVIMTNHFHLLLEVQDKPIWRIMQSLLTKYTKYFNKEYNRIGHLFQGRYKSIICSKDEYFLELVRYIHLNPVRAGVVKTAGEWKWSGHQEYLGVKQKLIDEGLLFGMFGKNNTSKLYVEFINTGSGVKYEEKFHPPDRFPVLGSKEFCKKVTENASSKNLQKKKKRTLEKIAIDVCRENNMDIGVLKMKTRVREVFITRKDFIIKAVNEGGYCCAEIARYLNLDISNVSRIVGEIYHLRKSDT